MQRGLIASDGDNRTEVTASTHDGDESTAEEMQRSFPAGSDRCAKQKWTGGDIMCLVLYSAISLILLRCSTRTLPPHARQQDEPLFPGSTVIDDVRAQRVRLPRAAGGFGLKRPTQSPTVFSLGCLLLLRA